MAYHPEAQLDPERLLSALENLCKVFGVPSLRYFQTQASQNILLGIDTVLDILTGGGKTLAFYLTLFYYIDSLDSIEDCKKIILDLAANKYRVGFLGPETAVGVDFHSKVLREEDFSHNVIAVIVDEAHCISEWGTDDFRPEFAQIASLRSRLPCGVPFLAASATLPPEVCADIKSKLGFSSESKTIAVSNAKPNVALSVCTLVHPRKDYADLLTLFPPDLTRVEDFPQTLIYVNSHLEAEYIQDFARQNRPECIPKESIEFYHRFIDEKRKEHLQDAIMSGRLLISSATDALGLGMNFRFVRCVILWLSPRTFLSLIQKIGRCVRNMTELGEVIVFITRASLKQYVIELDASPSTI
ncbi:P-loop containing nucleoside triphosphate hydrolase protein [Mycena floridula]|nr:P-loop containing nucleoside triphosphate hydrolase protein [Mycena floridula]